MPVRLRITLLFVLLVFIILSIVCGGIYYFSYMERIEGIKKRLTNRAITTARLLSQREIFDRQMIQRIDSSTTLNLKNKVVLAFDSQNKKIYSYSDVPGDSLPVDQHILDNARVKGQYYFSHGNKEAIAYYNTNDNTGIVMVSAAEDEDGRVKLHSLLNILLLSFLVGNIFMLVGGYVFSARLLRPIKQITADVEDISARNLARRIQTGKAKDEWFKLSDTLNELLNRLQDSFELQRRFISNASHELSTPLTAISSQLEVSLQRDRVASDYRKVMESIYQDVQHMSKLTQTLLEFAKASGNAGGLEIDLVRIDEIILGLPAEMVKMNPAFSVQLQFDALPENEEHLLVFGNEALLFTAIKNIVINACKYSDDHHARICLKITDAHISITVSDRGTGIPPEEIENIFQPFYRVDEDRKTVGFGLGLSLAARIVKLHKGEIHVSSRNGEGTEFLITFPSAHILRPLAD